MHTRRTRTDSPPPPPDAGHPPTGLRLRIQRSDGGTGRYIQDDAGRAAMVAQRLDPETMFRSGPIVIGALNPFTLLHPDQVCWIEVETAIALPRPLPPGVETLRRLPGRAEYEHILARQWSRWQRNRGETRLVEALVELTFKGGVDLHLHVTGEIARVPLTRLIYGGGALTANFEPGGTIYINPACIVRTRVYHSLKEVEYPSGLWCMEAEDI